LGEKAKASIFYPQAASWLGSLLMERLPAEKCPVRELAMELIRSEKLGEVCGLPST